MLYEYLRKNYKVNEPIFVTDVDLDVSDTNLRQMFKNLCDRGLIKRFDLGIYYLYNKNKNEDLKPSVVLKRKYISNKDEVYGYASGYTFANNLGLTTTFPLTIEITTNKTSAKYREVYIQNTKVILRKPKVTVNKDNVYILELLDLLKDADLCIDEDIINASEIITSFIRKNKIRRVDVDRYIGLFPEKVYKYIYEMRLYEAFL